MDKSSSFAICTKRHCASSSRRAMRSLRGVKRVNISVYPRRQGDTGTRRQGESPNTVISESPCLPFSLSPCPLFEFGLPRTDRIALPRHAHLLLPRAKHLGIRLDQIPRLNLILHLTPEVELRDRPQNIAVDAADD